MELVPTITKKLPHSTLDPGKMIWKMAVVFWILPKSIIKANGKMESNMEMATTKIKSAELYTLESFMKESNTEKVESSIQMEAYTQDSFKINYLMV